MERLFKLLMLLELMANTNNLEDIIEKAKENQKNNKDTDKTKIYRIRTKEDLFYFCDEKSSSFTPETGKHLLKHQFVIFKEEEAEYYCKRCDFPHSSHLLLLNLDDKALYRTSFETLVAVE